jgi:hypothetical protein
METRIGISAEYGRRRPGGRCGKEAGVTHDESHAVSDAVEIVAAEQLVGGHASPRRRMTSP